jgi:protein gp37
MTYWPERLEDTMPKKPAFIFCNSMSDIEYWPESAFRSVLLTCKLHARHTFIFLSKNPLSYSGVTWPGNTMQGLTMTLTQTQHCQHENVLEMMKYPRPFLSLEPLLGTLWVEVRDMQVIVGRMTGPGAIAPKREWVQSIKDNVPEGRIYWKQPELAEL